MGMDDTRVTVNGEHRHTAHAWLWELSTLDRAVYEAVASSETPSLDTAMRRLSTAADHSKISIGVAAAIAGLGGHSGRHTALYGLGCVAVTSTLVNLVAKPVGGRSRPDRGGAEGPTRRQVPMPGSRSFPSGHTASAFAFAASVGRSAPPLGPPLFGLAMLVGYSRVHTGVHYPGDVVAGALAGVAIADTIGALLKLRTGSA
jgi:membrane-associated phospholipid phosphatase